MEIIELKNAITEIFKLTGWGQQWSKDHRGQITESVNLRQDQ